MKLVLALCATLLTISGCAPSLARVASEPPIPELAAGGSPDLDRCQKLSRAESILRYVAVGSASLAGGTGLVQIPIPDDEDGAQVAMAITTGAFAAGAALAEAERAELAKDFERECNP